MDHAHHAQPATPTAITDTLASPTCLASPTHSWTQTWN